MERVTVGRVNKALPPSLPIRIDRQSVLGNPFVLGRDGDRATVIAKYHVYIYQALKTDSDVQTEFLRLCELLQAGHSLNLQCWCAPRACHGDHIKDILDDCLRFISP